MFRESSSELEDLGYYCPKCTKSFGSLQNLRDHLDIMHLYHPTRDTDDDTSVQETILDSLRKGNFSKPRSSLHSNGYHASKSYTGKPKEAAELERQLQKAKELELRHKILHRHSKSQDELKALNSEILSAKQRQYEMCNIIHGAREQVESLRKSAEKVTTDQQTLIHRLKDELEVKELQLDKATDELKNQLEVRLTQQSQLQNIAQENEQQKEAVSQLNREVENKQKQVTEKHREIATLKQFINAASQKELDARQKLEHFINSLLDRTEIAEDEVRKLRKLINWQNIPGIQGLPRSISDNDVRTASPNSRKYKLRAQSAEPMLSSLFQSPLGQTQSHPPLYPNQPTRQPGHSARQTPQNIYPEVHSARRTPQEIYPEVHSARQTPQQIYADEQMKAQVYQPTGTPNPGNLHTPYMLEKPRENHTPIPHQFLASPQGGPAFKSRKLPAGPFPPNYGSIYHAQAQTDFENDMYRKPQYKTEPTVKYLSPRRVDSDRPESGYSSIKQEFSRPHSRLSSVSETSQLSTDTVVPVASHHGEDLYAESRPYYSGHETPDDHSVFSDHGDPSELQVDDNGIMWDEQSGYESSSLPSKHGSLPRHLDPKFQKASPISLPPKMSQKSSRSPNTIKVPSPLNLSRLSSINSTEREILHGINKDAKLEIQRHKFLLRDRLRMLREQEKLFKKDGYGSANLSDSDLTSVTDDNDSLTSLTISSDSELEIEPVIKKLTATPKGKMPKYGVNGIKRTGGLSPKAYGKDQIPVISKPLSILPVSKPSIPPSPAHFVKVLPTSKTGIKPSHPPTTPQNTMTDTTPQNTITDKAKDPHVQRRHSVLFLIFMYLDTATLSQVSIMCKEWRDISRHPALWRRVVLKKDRITSKFFITIAQWCTEVQALTLEGLRARPKKSFEAFDEYKRKTRGCLEEGLEVLLRSSQRTLEAIRVIDCGNILTDRCLWLASCSCRLLRRVAYVSDTDPVGPEVIWSLGAGCREITTLVVPPLYPNERAERFTNRCVQMISWCWPDLRILAIGGKHIHIKGLVAVARNCPQLVVLELHQMPELTEETATAMCHAGLRVLERLDVTFTPVAPKAVVKFANSCASLKSVKIRVGISDYFTDVNKSQNKKAFDETVKKLQALKQSHNIGKILTLETDQK